MQIFGFAFSSADLWLFGGVGALLSWLVPYRLGFGKDAVARQRVAADAIASAFRQELTAIHQSNGDIGRHILTNAVFKKHEAAILNNVGELFFIQRMRLRWRWRRLAYHKKDKNQQVPFYTQYFDGGSLMRRRAIRPLVISRIKRIIMTIS